jgi:hypothetical protein
MVNLRAQRSTTSSSPLLLEAGAAGMHPPAATGDRSREIARATRSGPALELLTPVSLAAHAAAAAIVTPLAQAMWLTATLILENLMREISEGAPR